jgi:hypothetical protein
VSKANSNSDCSHHRTCNIITSADHHSLTDLQKCGTFSAHPRKCQSLCCVRHFLTFRIISNSLFTNHTVPNSMPYPLPTSTATGDLSCSSLQHSFARTSRKASDCLQAAQCLCLCRSSHSSGHRWLSTAAARVKSFRVLGFPLPIYIPMIAPHSSSSSSVIQGRYSSPKSNSGGRTKWSRSHPLQTNKQTNKRRDP